MINILIFIILLYIFKIFFDYKKPIYKSKVHKDSFTNPLIYPLNIWTKVDIDSSDNNNNKYHIKYEITDKKILRQWSSLPVFKYNEYTKMLVLQGTENAAIVTLYLFILTLYDSTSLSNIFSNESFECLLDKISNDSSVKNNIIKILEFHMNNKQPIIKSKLNKDLMTKSLSIWSKVDIDEYDKDENKYYIKYNITNKKILNEWKILPDFTYNEDTKIITIRGNEDIAISVLYLFILSLNDSTSLDSIFVKDSFTCLINKISSDISMKNNIIKILEFHMNKQPIIK